MEINRSLLKEFENIEGEFFAIDEKTGEAHVNLQFNKPSDVFNTTINSNIPMFSNDFDSSIGAVFEAVPMPHKIALHISFDDNEGYSSDELREIFRKNLMLKAYSHFKTVRQRNKIARSLIILGVVFFIGMVLVGRLWTAETLWHDVFFYFLDIAATVLLWEAAGILFVERKEHRIKMRSYRERCSTIKFNDE